MTRLVCVVATLLVLAACGGGEAMRTGFNGLVSCDTTSVHVSFDPTREVRVTDGDSTLARAGFGEQEVSNDCDVTREGAAPNTAKASPYDPRALPARGTYAQAEFDCRIPSGVAIDAHPILNGNTGVNDGSNVLLLSGKAIVLSAVLKDKGNPDASRVYHAPRFCTAP
jgi:hypothetical protein